MFTIFLNKTLPLYKKNWRNIFLLESPAEPSLKLVLTKDKSADTLRRPILFIIFLHAN